MLTEKDYCDYETCVALKELGCPLSSFDKWDNKNGKLELIPHFLLYSAQKWLREVKKIEVVVIGEKEVGGPYYADLYTKGGYAGYVHESFEKYESALLAGIKEAIKILKEK